MANFHNRNQRNEVKKTIERKIIEHFTGTLSSLDIFDSMHFLMAQRQDALDEVFLAV